MLFHIIDANWEVQTHLQATKTCSVNQILIVMSQVKSFIPFYLFPLENIEDDAFHRNNISVYNVYL